MKKAELRWYIYWGTAFALIPTTVEFICYLYGIDWTRYAFLLTVKGPLMVLGDLLFQYFPLTINIVENSLTGLLILVPSYLLLGIVYCFFFNAFNNEWSINKVFDPIPVCISIVLFLIILLELAVMVIPINWQIKLLLGWLFLPFSALYELCDNYVDNQQNGAFTIYWVAVFIGAYIASYSIMHMNKNIQTYIKNRRRDSAPPAGESS